MFVRLNFQQEREQCRLCLRADENPATFVLVTVLVLVEIDHPHFPGAIDHSGCKLGEFSTSRTCMEKSHDECPYEWREMWKSLLQDFPRDRPRVPLASLPPRPDCNGSTVTSRWSTSTGTSSRETPHRKTCLVRRVIALIVWRASDFLFQLSRSAINLVGPKDATGRRAECQIALTQHCS